MEDLPEKITSEVLSAWAAVLSEKTGVQVVPLFCSEEELAKHGLKAVDIESFIAERMRPRATPDLLVDKPKGVVVLVHFDHYPRPKLFALSERDSEAFRTRGQAGRSFGQLFESWKQ